MSKRSCPRWTAAEDHRLTIMWGVDSVEDISKAIGRTPTAIYMRSKVLGLQWACPQGFESITRAAERTGYAVKQIRAILHATGYTASIREAFSLPRGSRYRHQIIETDAVDAAVAKWMKLETIESAANRLNFPATSLRKLVARRLGPKPTRARCAWRVPSEVLEQIVAEARGAA